MAPERDVAHSAGRRAIRVLQVMPGLAVGGGQSNLLRQLRHMDPQRTSHRMVTLSSAGDMAAAFEDAGVPVTRVRYRGVRDLPLATLRLVSLIRREQVDVVQTNSRKDRLPGHLAALLARRPVVTVLRSGHSAHRYESEDRDLGPRMRARRRVELWLDRRTIAHVAAVSEDVKQEWQECEDNRGIAGGRVTVIYPGVEPAQLQTASEDLRPEELRTELGIPVGNPVLLNVARMVPDKRQTLLVPFMQRVLERFPDVHMLLAGDGPLRPEVDEAVRRAGLEPSIHVLGMRRDVPRLLALCDVFVFPSLREPFGNAPLEALAAGRPVVGFVPSALSEMVQEGRSGLLVPDGDVDALADAAGTLLGNLELARSMGACARRDVAERFDVRRMARSMTEIYESEVRT